MRFVRIIKGAGDVIDGKAQTISGLKKIDDFTLQMTLADSVDPGISLRDPGTAIVPKEAVEGKEDAFNTTAPVGCGPFKFVRWVKGSEVVLEKFPDFFMEGRPLLDKVVYRISNEASARDMAFRAKDLDATIVGSAQYEAYKNDPVISKNLLEVAEMFTRVVYFNLDYRALQKERGPAGHQLRCGQGIGHQEATEGQGCRGDQLAAHQLAGLRQDQQTLPVRPQEGQGTHGQGRLPERVRHRSGHRHRQRELGSGGLRGHAALPQGDRDQPSRSSRWKGRPWSSATRRGNSRPSSGP